MIRKLLKLILLVILILTSKLICAEEVDKYNPCPIVFVHGYNSVRVSDEEFWKEVRGNFEEFYVDSLNSQSKYPDESWQNYLNYFDYRAKSNGDLNARADELKNFVNDVLTKTKQEKVIIAAHSAGGLIVRRLLAEYPDFQQKVEKVVFIGTPHNGSPLASGVILADRMIPELEKKLKDAGKWGMLDFCLKSPGQFWAYRSRYRQIKRSLNLFKTLVNWDVKVSPQEMLAGDPQKDRGIGGRYASELAHNQGQDVAVGQLVVPENVTVEKTFTEKLMLGPFTLAQTAPLTATASYAKTETFLNNNTFAVPQNYAVIKGYGGADSLGAWCMGKTSGTIFQSLADFSGLPQGNTFAELDTGDGIVTQASQTAIGGEETYEIQRCHITETKDWQTILQAIEDKPEIESVRFVPTEYIEKEEPNPSWYVIVKVKDYLLADIEIADISIGWYDLDDFEEFYDPETGKYKPYVKFGKNLLKERIDKDAVVIDRDGNATYLHLEPGEFYIKIDCWYWNNGHITIRNPAQKEATCEFLMARLLSENVATVRKTGWERSFHLYEPYSSIRDKAYNDFINSEKEILFDFRGTDIGGGISGSGSYWVFNFAEAHIEMVYGNCCNFNDINITDDKRIKSVVTKGVLHKNISTEIPDFNIFIYKDSSNIWPPTLNSEGDTFIFNCNTGFYKDGEIFMFDLEPEDININGNNVWQTKLDFLEYNCIPVGLFEGEYRGYFRKADLNLRLIIVVEEKKLDE